MNQQVLDMQAKTIEQMKALQTRALDANERIAGTIVPMIPELPAQVADKTPAPADMLANYFDFIAELQTANREFMRSMMAAWIPTGAATTSGTKASKK